MTIPDLAGRLRDELARRRRRNPRYSVRSFGRFLGIDASTLSQILRGRRAVPPARVPAIAARLAFGGEETAVYAASAAADDPAALTARLQQLHWLAEAAAIIEAPAHWRLLRLVRAPDWRPDMRWAAQRCTTNVDALNEATSRLLRLRMLRVDEMGRWLDITGLDEITEQGVRECALARVREELGAARSAPT